MHLNMGMLTFFKGLIKIRGDRCWRDLTCMDYHYEVSVVVCKGRAGFKHSYAVSFSVKCHLDDLYCRK